MPRKAASNRVKADPVPKSTRGNGAKPRRKRARLSKIEAERLESFKALMKEYGGKCSFAGFDE